MNLCKLGFHKWAYTREGKGRWCKECQKKQELGVADKWVESLPIKRSAEDDAKFCQCPSDYTISIRTMLCNRCGLPRRPRILPSGNDTWRPR